MIPNPQIYEQDYGTISNDLLPVKKRTPIHLAWLKSLLSSAQWLHDLIFDSYVNGTTYTDWTTGNNYSYLDRVEYVDGAVYELEKTDGYTPSTIAPNVDPEWIKILDSFVGSRERARYNGQKLNLEFILNRRFKVASYSLVEWEIIWIAGVPTPQAAPPYIQIYITKSYSARTNFWLSNGSGLVSYMANGATGQRHFLGNAYSAFAPIDFTIWVPTALYTAIGSYQPPSVTADQAIRSIADKYVPAGASYVITQY